MSAQTRSKKSQAKDPGGSGSGTSDIESTLSKDEQAIARFLRLKCGTKQGNLAGMKVEFFIANKLVDQLMESKWGPGKPVAASSSTGAKPKAKESLLSNRAACVSLMQRLMNKQLFYRAYKVYKDEIESTGGNGNESTSEKTPNLRKRKKEKEVAAAESTPTAVSSDSTPKPGETTPQKETKRKFKLELHQDQKFVDGNEPYVWIYDPISTKSYIIGALLILGAIGICLFPLWPSQVREGVYYLSVAGASFLGAILAIAVIKYVLYALVWTFTLGKCQFWLFPNLTEDVGFVESFIPVYKVTCSSSKTEKPTTTESVSVESKEPTTTTLRSSGMSSSMTTSSMQTRKSAAVMNELSKSTVEISSTNTGSSSSSSSRNSTESPSVNKNRKSSLTASTLARDEEDFELVDNEELNNK